MCNGDREARGVVRQWQFSIGTLLWVRHVTLGNMICNAGGFETSDYIWYHGCGVIRLNETSDLLIAAFLVRKMQAVWKEKSNRD